MKPFLKHLIIIGGTGRNVGKTEFVCRLIAKISAHFHVYGLKVSAMFPDEIFHHGNHDSLPEAPVLFEEKNRNSHKDTSRMLRAGAERVFFLSGDSNEIGGSYKQVMEKIPPQCALVCESNSLADHVKPGLYIIISGERTPVKERTKEKCKEADMIVISDGKSNFSELEDIFFSQEKGWYLINRD